MAIKDGWKGRCYEDFDVGDVYVHSLGRTVLTTDNSWFTQLTMNTNPLHFDHQYATETEFGRPLVNSCFTLALVTGLSVPDLSQNAMANLGWDEVRLPAPVFEGDTIYAKSEGPCETGIQVAPERGHSRGAHRGLQPGRNGGHHLSADDHGVQTGACTRTAGKTSAGKSKVIGRC